MGKITLGVDIDVFRRALVVGSDGHEHARDVALRISTALESYAVVAPGILALIDVLVRDGAERPWATHRATDVLEMCRVLDVNADDVAAGIEMAVTTGVAPRVATTAATFARHGIAHVVAFAPGFELVSQIRRIPPDSIDELYDFVLRS